VKKFVVGLVVTGLFLAGMGTAFASSWHNIPDRTTRGVKFYRGRYIFWPRGKHHGSFEWKGKLEDAVSRDGNNVYIQVRIEGLPWKRYNGKQHKTVSLDHRNWVGSELYTEKARLRACRDRGSLHPDNCSPTLYYHRHPSGW
jgi:hypothetical protein